MSEPERLSEKLLAGRADGLAYDRSAITAGIVHLGVGAFHRAHQAVYFDECLALDPSWGVIGANLRSDATRKALEPQDGLYTLVIKSGALEEMRVVGSLVGLLSGEDGPDRIISAIAQPNIKLVTLTVTEKAYCRSTDGQGLDMSNLDIAHDIQNPEAPRSVLGMLLAGLKKRRELGWAGITILSCDNLPENGRVLEAAVMTLVAKIAPDLADWIKANVTFPCSMVDRITPATSERDKDLVAARCGYVDAWPVVTEPFSQWVVEDRFAAERPPLAKVGVQLTKNVAPFETMKLRLLNGAHSAIAYLGHHAGLRTVSDAMECEWLHRFVADMMRLEVLPTLPETGTDHCAYIDALLVRFANPALEHKTRQIAMDGSQKIPQRLLSTIADRLAQGEYYGRLAVAVAAWVRHAYGFDAGGQIYEVDDPKATHFRELASAASIGAFTEKLVAREDIFGAQLAKNSAFKGHIVELATEIFEAGPEAAVDRIKS